MPATAAPPARAPALFADPATLLRIRNLELRARTVVEGFRRGLHRSPFHGFSSEFTEYRAYVPGDDPRHLDWKLFARSDRACIRRFEDQTNVACHLVLDVSDSMTYGSAGHSKFEYARTLVASLATFLQQQGDATGLVTFSDAIRSYLPARRRHRGRREIFAALEQPAGGRGTAIHVPLDHLLRTERRRGLVILVSDLLAPLDALEPKLASLAACGHDVSVYQVLDPAEIAFPFAEAALFEDVETGLRRHVDPAAVRPQYLERLRRHQERVLEQCKAAGILHHLFPTDQPLERALFAHLHDRSRRHRQTRRARPTG